MGDVEGKKMKILCLHGFRTSGKFLKKQISKWDSSIFAHFDMDFPDGIHPAGGKSDIEGIFPGPYFEWFQFNKGKILKDQPKMKLYVSISGSKFREPSICEVAYKEPIKVKSIHFIGEKDWLKLPSEELATAFENPLIISHPQGHTVPRLDEDAVQKLKNWTEEIFLLFQSKSTTTSEDAELGETKNEQEFKN
ncbi:Hypothetical predicted protein [Olea europaea subsp. europaea]|uniref:Serine hydrolase domain-containing protein n=1 Tax=Olea europaea subsp. europaea TaxID=158383 RepID=A0A8S0TGC9_OLEEU|nr:Hypothetical predicted protein [Olea europaea subsp. europaea]